MSKPEEPNWETANGFTAYAVPLWWRQLVGGVVAALLVVAGIGLLFPGLSSGAVGTNHETAPQTLAISVGVLALSVLMIRFYVALGWRVVDELSVDFNTRALRVGQRRIRGRRVRSIEVSDLTSVREVSYGSYRGEPFDWFEFNLKTPERIRFRCPPQLLAITRRALQRVELLDDHSWKGKAVQPTAADRASPRP